MPPCPKLRRRAAAHGVMREILAGERTEPAGLHIGGNRGGDFAAIEGLHALARDLLKRFREARVGVSARPCPILVGLRGRHALRQEPRLRGGSA